MAKVEEERPDLVIHHPNRQGAAPNATRAVVVVLLLVSAFLIALITFGGWASLQGAQFVSVIYMLIYILMAYRVARWSRGVLPLSAALAIILGVFAAISATGWFARNHVGYANPGIPPDLIGMLDVALIPVEFLLIAFAMRGFSQAWNVEVEMSREEYNHQHGRRGGSGPGSGYRAQPQS